MITKNNLEIAVVNGSASKGVIRRLYNRHDIEGIPYIELRKGKKYGEIWFETPCEIPFIPQSVFNFKEWYENYWLERKGCKGLTPYRFSMGPTAVWFKFSLYDLDTVVKQLSRLSWERATLYSKNLPVIKETSDRLFWQYAEKYYEKSRSVNRRIGQKITRSNW